MLTVVIWIELIAAALLLWGALVRANAHFKTPLLRYVFSIPGWLACAIIPFAIVHRADFASQFAWSRPYVQSLDILIGDRIRLEAAVAALVPAAALWLLARGLRTYIAEDGRRVPRARRWWWVIVAGGPILLVGLIVAEVELIERSLRRQLEALGNDGQQTVASVKSRQTPLPDEQDAAEKYRLAWELVGTSNWETRRKSVRAYIWEIDWHGRDVPPLSPDEQRAAALIIEAGEMPECRFRSDIFDDEEQTVADGLRESLELLMVRRAATSKDAASFAESILAIRDFYTHVYRQAQLRNVVVGADELHYLFLAADLAARCPERLQGFTASALSDDATAAILSPIDDDVALLDAQRAIWMSKLFEPNMRADVVENPWRFGGTERQEEFGKTYNWFQRGVFRVDRISKVATALSAYSSRIDRFRQSTAATKAAGRPISSWVIDDMRAKGGTEIDHNYEDILQRLIGAAGARYQVLAARRLGNTALAAGAFLHKHGRLPNSVDELVPEFLNAVPIDPFTGESIRLDSQPDAILLYVCDQPSGESTGLMFLQDNTELDVNSLGAIRVRRMR